MRKVVFITAGSIVATFLGWVLFSDVRNSTTEGRSLGTVPSLTLQDYEGTVVALDSFKGTSLVINSWAVWCPFCREELPDFVRLQKEFEGEVVVIAIDRAESREKAQGFTDELGISNDIIFLLDPDDLFYKAIGGFAMPETIFVNAEGEIIVHKRGFMDIHEMRRHTQTIIE